MIKCSPTPSMTNTPSVSPSLSSTPPVTPTPTQSKSLSNSVTKSVSNSASRTPTPTTSHTRTPSMTMTASSSLTPSTTTSRSATVGPSPSASPPPPSATPSVTPSITTTTSTTPTPTQSSTPTPTKTATRTTTPTNSVTKSVSVSVSPTKTRTPSVTSTPGVTPSSTPSVTPSNSNSASVSMSRTSSNTPIASPSNSLSASITRTPSISFSPTPTTSLSMFPTQTPTPTPTPSITPTRSPINPSSTPTTTPTPSTSDACLPTEIYDYELPSSTGVVMSRSTRIIVDSGPIEITSVTHQIGGCTPRILTLSGTSNDYNTITNINNYTSSNLNLTKDGDGTWTIVNPTGVAYGGRLRIEEGTLIAEGNAPIIGNGVFGSAGSSRPIIGKIDSSGVVSLLVVSGYTISRSLEIADLGTGDQEVILGGTGGGTSIFASTSNVRSNRDVTLAANYDSIAVFRNGWQDSTGVTDATIALNIGTSTLDGIVSIESILPSGLTGINVRSGSLILALSGGETIHPDTTLSIGSDFGLPVVDLNGEIQTLASLLMLTGGSSNIIAGGGGGALHLSGASVVVDAGTNHYIDSDVVLNANTDFDVYDGAELSINGVISGNYGVIVSGSGSLRLANINTYTEDTDIQNGSLIITQIISGPSIINSAVFTPATLTVDFSTDPSSMDAFQLLPAETVQIYGSGDVVLTGTLATATYDSLTSTLTID